MYHLFLRAEIACQRFPVVVSADSLVVRKVGHNVPIAVAPAVNALFYIAHNEYGLSPGGENLLQQRQEHLPLQFACVLELIYHDVAIADTDFFQYEIGVTGFEGIAQDG